MPKQSQGPRLVKIKGRKNRYVRYIDETTGKQKDRSTGTEDLHEAEEFLEEFLSERRSLRLGLAVYPHQITVDSILTDYGYFKMGEACAERLSYSIVHLIGYWGGKTLDHVNKETIQIYTRQANRSKSTVRRELSDLRAAINHAIAMNRVKSFSFPAIPKNGKSRTRWLTEDEFAALLCAAGKDFRSKFTLRLFLEIAFYTGARKQAILDLEWSQVNFDDNIIDFNEEDDDDSEREQRKPRAATPMAPQLRHFLQRRFRVYGNQTSFLFHQKKNPKKRVKHIDKGFRSAVKRAGLKNVVPHTLRHTRVSLLVQSGEKIQDVSAFINMSYQTLEKVYYHFDKTRLQAMAQRAGRTQKGHTTKNYSEQNKEKHGTNGEVQKGKTQ